MSKILLDNITSGYKVSKINANFDKIAQALNTQVLYRDNPDGEPNVMQGNLDMNGKNLMNVGGLVGDVTTNIYLHIKYSNNGGTTFTGSDGNTPGDWLGQYVSSSPTPSLTTSNYTWSYIKGAQGPQGLQGTPGPGTYFHVAYSTAPDGSANFNHTSGPYIGTYVDQVQEDSNNPSAYVWKRFQGVDGIAGVNGSNGQTSYLHLKYSNDGGITFTAGSGEVPGAWLGQYVDFTLADSNSPSAYTWTKIEGPEGPQGTQGIQGPQGTSSYFHVAYADNNTGTLNFNQIGGAYIGTYVDSNPTDSVNPAAYTWQQFTGSEGIPGVNGSNGQTSYLHLKYSNDGGATFTTNSGEDPGSWLGQYVDFSITDSGSVGAYTWTKIQGATGLVQSSSTNITQVLYNGAGISFLGTLNVDGAVFTTEGGNVDVSITGRLGIRINVAAARFARLSLILQLIRTSDGFVQAQSGDYGGDHALLSMINTQVISCNGSLIFTSVPADTYKVRLAIAVNLTDVSGVSQGNIDLFNINGFLSYLEAKE